MACMEHVCRNCDWTTFNNRAASGPCPKCGGHDFKSYFDEDPDDGRDVERECDDAEDE